MRERQPCVYILASLFNGTFYVGVTSNLIGRIMQHRAGTFRGFTKRHGVYILVWFEMAETMEAAIVAEKRINKWPRDYKKNLIERTNPHWEDLAVGLGLPLWGRSLAWMPPRGRHDGVGRLLLASCRACPGIHRRMR